MGLGDMARRMFKPSTRVTDSAAEGTAQLLVSAKRGDVEGVHKLLAAGADPNGRDATNMTACHYACIAPPKLGHDVLQSLINAGANLLLDTKEGNTPLHVAAARGHMDHTLLLIRSCPRLINVRNKDGRTALHLAELYSHHEVAQILALYGADAGLVAEEAIEEPIIISPTQQHPPENSVRLEPEVVDREDSWEATLAEVGVNPHILVAMSVAEREAYFRGIEDPRVLEAVQMAWTLMISREDLHKQLYVDVSTPPVSEDSSSVASTPKTPSKVRCKVDYGGEVRVVNISRNHSTVSSVLELLCKGMEDNVDIGSLQLKYKDGEGEWISVVEDEELQEAWEVYDQLKETSKNPALRLTINFKAPLSSSTRTLPEDSVDPSLLDPVSSTNTVWPVVAEEKKPADQLAGNRHLWSFVARLGSGSFGVVYSALALTDLFGAQGKMVAIKQVVDSSLRNERCIESLRKEVALLEKLEHSNIVRFYGFHLQDQTPQLVQEFVAGGTLAALARQFGGFKGSYLPTLRKYVVQIVKGLVYLHSNCVIHGDVKGANILLAVDGTLKLADFGCAKVFKSLDRGSQEHAKQSVEGTMAYMAPEVMKGSASRKSDVWALGCTVIELVSAERPWREVNSIEEIMFLMHQEKKAPKIPDELEGDARVFVERCLTFDMKERPTSQELLQDPYLR